MKKLLSFTLALIMLATAMLFVPFAANAESYNGVCGENISWSFDTSSGKLSISGYGRMTDYSFLYQSSKAPWASYRGSIKEINISSGITSIGSEAFLECESIESVVIPDSVTSIGEASFRDCVNLKSVTIPENVTEINDFAFCGCFKLTSIYIPDGVTKISDYAFCDCHCIESVVIPDKVTSIGDSSFDGCIGLKSVTIPASVKRIEKFAFNYCIALTDINYFGTAGDWNKIFIDKENDYDSLSQAKIHYCVPVSAVAPTCTKNGYTAGVKCSDCEKIISGVETIKSAGHKYVTTKSTLTKNGIIKCTACGFVKQTIAYPKTIKLSATSYTYDGKVKKPTVKVTDSKGKAIAASNYTVTYSNNKNVGKASVKITFKGNYSGTKTLYFTIVPKATTIASIIPATKAMTVKWKKQTTQTTGYQLQYSTSSNFASAKTVNVGSSKTVSKKITKLIGKKYYVRIRTYKTVGSAKYYSAWSKAKAVTVKGATTTAPSKKTSTTVYITPTGKCYHNNSSCAGKNALKRNLNDVKNSYKPCKKCVG